MGTIGPHTISKELVYCLKPNSLTPISKASSYLRFSLPYVSISPTFTTKTLHIYVYHSLTRAAFLTFLILYYLISLTFNFLYINDLFWTRKNDPCCRSLLQRRYASPLLLENITAK
jgi:hypothetical protein